jgi:uncharacterized protein YdeI (YjbR/CyaY-like superfamily)
VSAPDLVFADEPALRAWLEANEASHEGGWLLLAKKGTTSPTALSYHEALLAALCSGWIDGQRKSIDEATFMIRFTPRRARSIWSQRNVDLVAQLEAEGRMRQRGRDEVAKAQADGRWERAYAGSAAIEVPGALREALLAAGAWERFEALSKSARYSLLHPIVTAARETTRAARIERAVAGLAE